MTGRRTYLFPFSRYPAVRIAFLMIAGILSADVWASSITIIFFIVLSIYAITEWFNTRKNNLALARSSGLIFLLLIFLFGNLRMTLHQNHKESPFLQLIKISEWESITVAGRILSISETTTGKERWELSVQSTTIKGITYKKHYKLRVLAEKYDGSLTLGDHVVFSGTLIPVSEKRNPLEFDYRSYLLSRDIISQIRLEHMLSTRPNNDKLELLWWREYALGLIEKIFDSSTAPIAKALLLGYKQELDHEDKTAFARTGLSHIMAVSGLHVGFIIAPFWLLIPLFWSKRFGRILGLTILILILGSYAGMTGFSASVMRASVMAAFITIARLFHKNNNSINITAASAIALLMIDPEQIFDIGFQLSYSAVIIILLILPVIQQKLPYRLQLHWYGIPVMAMIISLVVQFGLYPLQVYYFSEISLISPIANALFVPFLGIVIPLSLLAVAVSVVLPSLGFILNYPSLLFLHGLTSFVEYTSQFEWAWASVSFPGIEFFILWTFLILFVACLYLPALRIKMVIGCLAVLCLMQFQNMQSKLAFQPLKMIFFDVGQGDAALITTPAGKNILIDTGRWYPGYSSGKYIILPHLRKAGVKKLDAIILSHPHADHIGGILDIIEEIPVEVIYNSGYRYDSNIYQSYIREAASSHIPVINLKAGQSLNIDPSILILVLGPDGFFHNSDPNEHSVILNLIYGQTSFLFTGDAGKHQEQHLIDRYASLIDADLIKVGHHGSRTSTGLPFLRSVTPEIAVISLGKENKFKHPHYETVQRLSSTGAELLFTSREKAVIISSDGSSIKRHRWY